MKTGRHKRKRSQRAQVLSSLAHEGFSLGARSIVPAAADAVASDTLRRLLDALFLKSPPPPNVRFTRQR
jgi:hypothetical protein